MSSPFESSLPGLSRLFSTFQWHILMRIMSKPLLKLPNKRGGGPLKLPNKRGEGIAITYPRPQENHGQNIIPLLSPQDRNKQTINHRNLIQPTTTRKL